VRLGGGGELSSGVAELAQAFVTCHMV
jgi:hypothetical protein